jgi:hypothetical protein
MLNGKAKRSTFQMLAFTLDSTIRSGWFSFHTGCERDKERSHCLDFHHAKQGVVIPV